MQIQFETAPDLVSGIEMSSNGHKVAWSIGAYLGALGKAVDALLKPKPEAEIKTGQNVNEHGL
jgi:F-type H+-transporting ATPase subunit b